MTPQEVIAWAYKKFGTSLAMTTSFGVQSAVMLHLVSTICPDVPIVFVDTGYLPPETYQFAADLIERLNLKVKFVQSELSPARMEAMFGKLYTSNSVDDLNLYDTIRKVTPMKNALNLMGAKAVLSGLRRQQTQHRAKLPRISNQSNRYKVLPIIDWSNRDVHRYLLKHNLPYHPLFEQGYMTIGDWHSSRPITADDKNERDTRFKGLKQECGLHL